MSNFKSIDYIKHNGKKIGYIKINSEKGQLSYSIKEFDRGVMFYNLRYHPENIKPYRIIFHNVVHNYMNIYANVIREYNENLIEKYFNKKINDFHHKINNYGGWGWRKI